jgi:hypothetical protein
LILLIVIEEEIEKLVEIDITERGGLDVLRVVVRLSRFCPD